MDRLQAMASFVRVVESGSFSAVARESHSTQSAVSRQIAALERVLGAKLLSRTTRSLALTEEGERYFEQARRLVGEIAEAEALVRRSGRQLSGLLRVAAPVGFARIKLLPLVQSFVAKHPQVRIDLRVNDQYQDLVEEGIDMAVRFGVLADSSLLARRVGTTFRRLVAHRDYLRRRRPKLRRPEDLARHDCLIYTGLRTPNQWSFVAGVGAPEPVGTERSVRVQGSLQTNSGELLGAALLRGMGVAFSPEWMFERELASGELVRLLPDWDTPPLPMHIISPPARRSASKVIAFGEYVAQAFAGRQPAP